MAEWHPILFPSEFGITSPGALSLDERSKLLVSRTSDLRLLVSIKPGATSPKSAPIPGTPVQTAEVDLQAIDGAVAMLRGFRTRSRSALEIVADAESLELCSPRNDTIALVEWVIHMPDLVWPRFTQRNDRSTKARQREGDQRQANEEQVSTSDTFDHARIKLALPTLKELLIGSVDRKFVVEGDAARDPGFLEFTRGPQGLPNERLRHGVKRGLELFFGGGLGLLLRDPLVS